jgi:hypothetical protein
LVFQAKLTASSVLVLKKTPIEKKNNANCRPHTTKWDPTTLGGPDNYLELSLFQTGVKVIPTHTSFFPMAQEKRAFVHRLQNRRKAARVCVSESKGT